MLTSDQFLNLLSIVLLIVGGGLVALWIGLIVWTFRDIRNRSRDLFAQIISTLLVALLPIPGILIYLLLRPPETLADHFERMLEEEALLQGIEGQHKCPGCSRSVESDWQVCPYCHVRLKVPCIECGRLIDQAWQICPFCAAIQVEEAFAEEQS